MYRNDRQTGNREHFGGNRNDRDNTGTYAANPVPANIIKYLKNESMSDQEKYEIFRLEGSIKKTYCGKEKDEAKMNQLRKFYDEILSIHEEYPSNKKSAGGKLIRMLPVARYAYARDLINKDLLKLISEGIEIVSSQKDEALKIECLGNFRNVMEAVIAYSKKEKGRNKNE